MSREADKKIAEVLEQYGIPFAGNVWRVQGTPVIYHKALEEIAAKLGIVFQSPTILRAERDECVMLVHGSMLMPDKKTTRHEWSVGEALVNVNYRVSGKQAAYVYAMAEKRAKDRVILKLIDLAGHVYSEEEADDFKHKNADRQESDRDRQQDRGQDRGQGRGQDRQQDRGQSRNDRGQGRQQDNTQSRGQDRQQDRRRPEMTLDEVENAVRERIDAGESIDAVTDVMLSEETQQQLAYLAPGVRDDVRAYARERLVSLGWPAKSNRRAA